MNKELYKIRCKYNHEILMELDDKDLTNEGKLAVYHIRELENIIEKCVIMEDHNLITNCALRHSLGRHTYICHVTANYIKRNIKMYSKIDIDLMIRDIQGYFGNELIQEHEHKCDQDTWQDLLEFLTKITEK